MNILEPYKNIEPRSIHSELSQFNFELEQLRSAKHKEIADYIVSMFKNKRFINKQINRYKENVDDLICDLIMVNNIKKVVDSFVGNQCRYGIAFESYNEAELEYSFSVSEDNPYHEIEDNIKEIYEDISCDNCFSELVNMCLLMLDGSYFDLLDCDVEYVEDYRCEDRWTIRSEYIPIVDELDAFFNKNSNLFIELIKNYQ